MPDASKSSARERDGKRTIGAEMRFEGPGTSQEWFDGVFREDYHQGMIRRKEAGVKIERIMFVEPSAPGYHIYTRFPIPRLGLPLLSAIVSRRGIDSEIWYGTLETLDPYSIREADMICISTLTSTAPEAYRIADAMTSAGKIVVMGGPHVTFMTEEALAHSHYVVRGEGEETFVELIDHLEGGFPIEEIRGLSYENDGVPVHNPRRPLLADLDSLPFPDLTRARGKLRMRNVPIQTSRGCPFDCTFCSVTEMFGRGYRHRSVESAADEMGQLPPGGTIFVCDDNFTANKRFSKELLAEMVRRDHRRDWGTQVRADIARDDELLGLMKRAHCFGVSIGLESANPRTLELYKKGQTVEEIEAAVKKIRSFGIWVHGMFVLGSDEDGPETATETLAFAKRCGLDSVQFLILTPLPGTSVYDEMEKNGRLFTKDWSLYDGHHVTFRPKTMDPGYLQEKVMEAMNGFYSRRYLVKSLLGLKPYRTIFVASSRKELRAWDRANSDFKDWIKDQYEGAGRIISERLTGTGRVLIQMANTLDMEAVRIVKRKVEGLIALGRSKLTLDLSKIRNYQPPALDALKEWVKAFGEDCSISLVFPELDPIPISKPRLTGKSGSA